MDRLLDRRGSRSGFGQRTVPRLATARQKLSEFYFLASWPLSFVAISKALDPGTIAGKFSCTDACGPSPAKFVKEQRILRLNYVKPIGARAKGQIRVSGFDPRFYSSRRISSGFWPRMRNEAIQPAAFAISAVTPVESRCGHQTQGTSAFRMRLSTSAENAVARMLPITP